MPMTADSTFTTLSLCHSKKRASTKQCDVRCWHIASNEPCAQDVRNVGTSGLTPDAKSTRMTQPGHRAVGFAVMHNGPYDVVGYVRRPRGAFSETASHCKPEISKNSAWQDHEAEAQLPKSCAPRPFLGCQSAREARYAHAAAK